MRRGSALLMALVTIAVLSIMVISFVYEARQQGGINVYVRERNRVLRLIEAGQAIAEIVMCKYSDAPEWSEDQDTEQLLEDDRWILAKQDLKSGGQCTIGPILLDEERDKDGYFVNPATVTIEIGPANDDKININTLWKGANDDKYMERWWMIFKDHDIPEELATPKDGTINLWNILIASWDDWRDEDHDVTNIELEEAGAEDVWYEEYESDNGLDRDAKYLQYRTRPTNDEIDDIHELENLRGWREYPQVLTGGVINPWEDRKEDQITVRGVLDVLTADGPAKINVNNCKNVGVLITIPGIYENIEYDDVLEEAKSVAQAVLAAKSVMPDDRDVDPTKSEWPFKDFDDLCRRMDEVGEDIGSEASNYLQYISDDFTVKITGESMGMTHTVEAKCYVKDGKVRYYKWCENPIQSGSPAEGR